MGKVTIVSSVSLAPAGNAEAVQRAFDDLPGGPWTVVVSPSEARGRAWWSVKVIAPRRVLVMSVLPEELGERLRRGLT